MASTDTIHQARESWLAAAVEIFRPRFDEVGFPLPKKVRISVGFGPQGARQESAKILGVCLATVLSADSTNEIFVSPEDVDTIVMLETVLHELIHAALDCQDGHKGRFAEIATRLGFLSPMTETPASPSLQADFLLIAEDLGHYPGAAVLLGANKPIKLPVGPDGLPFPITSGPGGGKTQTTRMRLVQCETDGCDAAKAGYKLRMTKTHLESFGAPKCPECDWPMAQH
jgi:hypothetical protein